MDLAFWDHVKDTIEYHKHRAKGLQKTWDLQMHVMSGWFLIQFFVLLLCIWFYIKYFYLK